MGDEEKHKMETNFLGGRLLLAMPGMGDPRFYRAVIFMCAHDKNGAMGLVVNHVLPGIDMKQLLGQLNLTAGIIENPALAGAPVLSGGPVESARGFILHSSDFKQSDTVTIDDKFSVTGTIDALRAIVNGEGPGKMLFALGYAGWSPGQLDREIQDNAWLVTEADPSLIFDEDPEKMWDKAVKSMGIDPAMLSGDAGHA